MSKLKQIVRIVEDLNRKHKKINMFLNREELFNLCDIQEEDPEYWQTSQYLGIRLNVLVRRHHRDLKVGYRDIHKKFYVMDLESYNVSGLREELIDLRTKLDIYSTKLEED